MTDGHLRHDAVALVLGSVMTLTACGTTLRPVDDTKTATLLSPQHILFVHDSCSGSLTYADHTERILVYRLDFDHDRPICERYGPYELVVILDRDHHVVRYRLLRVR